MEKKTIKKIVVFSMVILSIIVLYGAMISKPISALRAVTSVEKPILTDLQSQPLIFEISKEKTTGQIYFIKVNKDSSMAKETIVANPDFVMSSNNFLDTNKVLMGITDINKELIKGETQTDTLGMTHVTYYQKYNNILVLGGEIKTHLDKNGQVTSVSTKFVPKINVNTQPSITASQSKNTALAKWNAIYPFDAPISIDNPSLIIFPYSMINNEPDGKVYLAYQVRISSNYEDMVLADETYYIDAATGKFIQQISNNREYGSCPTANATIYPCRRVYDCDTFPGNSSCGIDYNTTQYPTYYFGRSEGRPPRGPNPRPNPPSMFGGSNDTDKIFNLFMNVHQYWNLTFNRFGANNRGGSSWGANENYTRGFSHLDMAPIGLINCPGGHAWFAGSNQAIHFCLNTITPEMMGHEYAHAVLFYEFYNASSGWPVGPLYYGETGALDESHSDLSGEFLERDYYGTHNWIIGGVSPMNWSRNLITPEATNNSVNYVPYPNRFMDPNFYCGLDDNAGVHVGLSVPSKAGYLSMVGGKFNGCEIQAIGEPAFEKILYRVWDVYTTSTESFNAYYTHMIQSCQDLYNSTHPEYCTSITKSLQAVEMDQAGKCSNQTEVAPLCAVKNIPNVFSRKANGAKTTYFAIGENIWVGGQNGIAGKTVTIHFASHVNNYTSWSKITSTMNVTTTVQPDGTIALPLTFSNQVGTYDIIIDGDQDGIYLSWADSIIIVNTYTPTIPSSSGFILNEGENISFVRNYGPFGSESLKLSLPLSIPQGATMPEINWTSPTISSTFNWTPNLCQGKSSNYTFPIYYWRSSDTTTYMDLENVSIKVNNINRAPFFDTSVMFPCGPSQVNAIKNQQMSISVIAKDLDKVECANETHIISLECAVAPAINNYTNCSLANFQNFSWNNGGTTGIGNVNWTPSEADVGKTFTFTLNAKDDSSATAQTKFQVCINTIEGSGPYVAVGPCPQIACY